MKNTALRIGFPVTREVALDYLELSKLDPVEHMRYAPRDARNPSECLLMAATFFMLLDEPQLALSTAHKALAQAEDFLLGRWKGSQPTGADWAEVAKADNWSSYGSWLVLWCVVLGKGEVLSLLLKRVHLEPVEICSESDVLVPWAIAKLVAGDGSGLAERLNSKVHDGIHGVGAIELLAGCIDKKVDDKQWISFLERFKKDSRIQRGIFGKVSVVASFGLYLNPHLWGELDKASRDHVFFIDKKK